MAARRRKPAKSLLQTAYDVLEKRSNEMARDLEAHKATIESLVARNQHLADRLAEEASAKGAAQERAKIAAGGEQNALASLVSQKDELAAARAKLRFAEGFLAALGHGVAFRDATSEAQLW